MRIVRSDDEGLEVATSILMNGGIAVIPTDTVYGLAAHPSFPSAVDRLYTVKGRSEKKPIALLSSDIDAIEKFGAAISTNARKLADYWPGALTLILPIKGCNYNEGFRVPDHEWTRKLLNNCGGTLRVTSANLSGQRPATDAEHALAEVGLSADVVVDDGVSPGGVASTVVRLTSDGGLDILREGAIKIDAK